MKDRGQSTIEFLMVFIFAIGIFAAFIQLAINFAGGYLVHYATFMASRTFLVYEQANPDVNTDYIMAMRESRKVLKSYGFDDSKTKFNYRGGGTDVDYFFTGVFHRYQRPMSIFEFFGGGVKTWMYSESFLGKEPTRGECWLRTKKAMENLAIESNELKRFTTVFDNGC